MRHRRNLGTLRLKVTFKKLEKYTREHGSFELSCNGKEVTLVFVPTLPEVLEKGVDESPPRVIMHGEMNNGTVEFATVEIETKNGTSEKDSIDAEMTYGSWLDYIEENY